MKKLLLVLLLGLPSPLFSQCEIKNRLIADGSMQYYIEPVNFYWTKNKSLQGNIITDMENYFIGLEPTPFPEKPLGNKLKKDVEVKLGNDKVYFLKHYESRYLKRDSSTVLILYYLIDKKSFDDFLNYEVISVKIDMGDSEGIRNYYFKLHKAALKEQLACFLKMKEKKKDTPKENKK